MKFIKWVAGIILFVLIALFITIKVVSEKRPEAVVSAEADQLAQAMTQSMGVEGWDTLKLLQWTFPGGHHYLWDKVNNRARIAWGENVVLLNLDQVDGVAWSGGVKVTDDGEWNKLKNKAWEYWCNDSFWMFAPFKVFDPGTTRGIVKEVEHGKTGLMVTYESGGVTPGDAYLWHLDEKNQPIGFKMWVKIIPVGGIYFTWDGWKTMDEGFQLSTTHKSVAFTIQMEDVASGNHYSEMGYDEDPFKEL